MKKKLMIVFTFIFAFNTLSLSAFAASCPHLEKTKITQIKSNMPDCHKKAEQQKAQKHCKGLCFCLHAQLSHNILPFDDHSVKIFEYTGTIAPSKELLASVMVFAPLLRPPILHS